MFASGKSLVAPSGAGPDAQFNYVTMLLHGDGTNGAQNNTFLDSSTNNFTISRNGNTTQGSFSPYGSNWSNYFDGTGDYLSIADNAALDMGSSSFTIEGWFLPQANVGAGKGVFGKRANNGVVGGILFYFSDTGVTPRLLADIGGSWGVDITASSGFTLGQWNHFAVVRNSNTWTIYINGTSVGSATNSGTVVDSSAAFTIMAESAAASEGTTQGYISNFRVVKGTAVYTTNFTPPTALLTAIANTSLLTCQSNRFIDNSTNNFTITRNGDTSVQRFSPFSAAAYSTSVTGGSGFFDGTGDYLNTASDAAFTLGSSGNFTVECWVYLNGSQSSSYAAVMTNMATFSNAYANRWAFTINGLNLRWYNSNGDGVMDVSVVPYQWIHLAAVRSGSTITIYVNGVAVAGQTTNQAYTTEGSLKIGFLTGAAAFKGYIADARVVKGTAVYTADFTPPTAPLTAITNTTFLANTTNGAIFDNAMMTTLETVGDAQISTSVKKYGTGSIAFDGTGDYLQIPYSPNFQFGTGAYTVEFWINTTATDVWIMFNAATDTGIRVYITSTGTVQLNEQVSNVDSAITSTTAINNGAWRHVAFSRVSGQGTKMFVDGVYQDQLPAVYNFSNTSTLYIGTRSSLVLFFNGYLDDFRITKGYARYTTTFTPPTAAFSNTSLI
jgi:hypothetical protein